MALPARGNVQIRYSELDIADAASVEDFAKKIKDAHGKADVLINNAAAHDADKTYSPQVVKIVLTTNIEGTLRVSIKE